VTRPVHGKWRGCQKHLSVAKVCKSTLSDFSALADPQRLEPIIFTARSVLRQCLGKYIARRCAAEEKGIRGVMYLG
jgi:hypothetical protein